MATKKGTKKGTKKPKATAKKRTAASPKKAVGRRSKSTASRRPAARKAARKKASERSAPTKSRASLPSTKASARKTIRREDRPGHLDPHYAAELRRQSGPRNRDPSAFFETPRSPRDDFAEERGEAVVEKATTGEDEAEDTLDQIVPEEQGGPFVETSAAQEFASGTDASNPRGAKREPFPTT